MHYAGPPMNGSVICRCRARASCLCRSHACTLPRRNAPRLTYFVPPQSQSQRTHSVLIFRMTSRPVSIPARKPIASSFTFGPLSVSVHLRRYAAAAPSFAPAWARHESGVAAVAISTDKPSCLTGSANYLPRHQPVVPVARIGVVSVYACHFVLRHLSGLFSAHILHFGPSFSQDTHNILKTIHIFQKWNIFLFVSETGLVQLPQGHSCKILTAPPS